jgi:transposase-like protein
MSSATPDLSSIPRVDGRLKELVEGFGLEAGSRAYLEEIRGPDGVRCARCSSPRTGFIDAREKYYCRDCSYQFRVSAGTVLHDSHAALGYWLVAVGLILESAHGYPATQLHQALGGSYKTAWFVEHRIRSAMSAALVTDDPSIDRVELPIDTEWAEMRSLAAGAYHRPSVDHINAYWGEALWRRRSAGDENAFRKTVAALLDAEPLTMAQLTRRGRTAQLCHADSAAAAGQAAS